MTSLGPNEYHPFYWLVIYSNLHKPKINAPEYIWFIAYWSPENNLLIPRCCSSKEYVQACCWITKKNNLGSKLDKLISNWCQTDNCFMGGGGGGGGYAAIFVTKTGHPTYCCEVFMTWINLHFRFNLGWDLAHCSPWRECPQISKSYFSWLSRLAKLAGLHCLTPLLRFRA